MKILLRYQISGSIFIGWFLLFHYSVHSADLADMATKIMDISSLASLIIAMPIGAIIHQFSVTIKNQIYGGTKGLFGEGCYQLLSDSPKKDPTRLILEKYKNEREFVQYISDKISNLNSFYYMRFDCGFLAPLLALILFITINYHCIDKIILIFISFLIMFMPTLFYVLYHESKSFVRLLLCIGWFLFPLVIVFCPKILPLGVNQTSINYVESSIIGNINITKTYNVERNESISNYIQHFEKNKTKPFEIELTKNLARLSLSNEDIESIGYNNIKTNESLQNLTNVNVTIKPLDGKLLNKILLICFLVSFLLLSYIPRIIQEIEEYTNELLQDKKINIQLIPRFKRK